MSVTLYKAGTLHKVNGIRCEMKSFNEFDFTHMLEDGWFLSPEEVYAEKTEEKTEEVVDITAGLTNKEIRALAKEVGIKSWHNKGIKKLKKELAKNDAQS